MSPSQISLTVFRWLWGPTLLVPIPFAAYSFHILLHVPENGWIIAMLIISILPLFVKLYQIMYYLFSGWFSSQYIGICFFCTLLSFANLVFYISVPQFHKHTFLVLGIYVVLNFLRNAFELWFLADEQTRRMCVSRTVLECLDELVAGDSTSFELEQPRPLISTSQRLWRCFLAIFSCRNTGPIALPTESDPDLELGLGAETPAEPDEQPRQNFGSCGVLSILKRSLQPRLSLLLKQDNWRRHIPAVLRHPSTGPIALRPDSEAETVLRLGSASATQNFGSWVAPWHWLPLQLKQFQMWHIRFPANFRRHSTGPIALPTDSNPEIELELEDTQPTQNSTLGPWAVLSTLGHDLQHWLHLRQKQNWRNYKALWIAADSKAVQSRILTVCAELLSSPEIGGEAEVVLADTSDTNDVYWPFVRALVSASPEYSLELAEPQGDSGQSPEILLKFLRGYPIRSLMGFQWRKRKTATWEMYHHAEHLVRTIITRPFRDVCESHSNQPWKLRRTIILVHGLRNNDQAQQIYDTLKYLRSELKEWYELICVVVIGEPSQLSTLAERETQMLQYMHTMYYVPTTEVISYSGNKFLAPALNKSLAKLLRRAVNSLSSWDIERLWLMVLQLSADIKSGKHQKKKLEGDYSARNICLQIHVASQFRKQLLEALSMTYESIRSQAYTYLRDDNIEAADLLQTLLLSDNFREEIEGVPEDHAISVLNMMHAILDNGLPQDEYTKDYKVFRQRAHRLLNSLSTRLRLLPEELAIAGIELLSEHPMKHGGFANIYRGRYTNTAGHEMQVALKVLKVFEDQSDELRQKLLKKFSKEALVWRYLKHKNIVEFLGVDSTTFPSPAHAMVSPWMEQGSVLKYMLSNSPSSNYAVLLLSDVIVGLQYLEEMNIVHGDLCGRNILIEIGANGRPIAMLTDFGLANFLVSESVKSSTRSGSSRWMAPELLVVPAEMSFKRTVASDIWAFGCVCCEIWTEGCIPFSQFPNEAQILLTFFEPKGLPSEMPYTEQPCDKQSILMPEQLWGLIRWCWKLEASQRPAGEVCTMLLREMAQSLQGVHEMHMSNRGESRGDKAPTI